MSQRREDANFELTGIAPAPRGLPKIEVTFDIDANGIVHVSAKDKGTGREQSMTITGGSSLPKDEIDRMVREAEAHAEEDKKRRELADEKNKAEALRYSVSKSLAENKAKLADAVATDVQAKLDALETAARGDDLEAIKTASSDLQAAAMKIGEAIYASQQSDGSGATTPGSGDGDGPDGGDVVEAEVVDE